MTGFQKEEASIKFKIMHKFIIMQNNAYIKGISLDHCLKVYFYYLVPTSVIDIYASFFF